MALAAITLPLQRIDRRTLIGAALAALAALAVLQLTRPEPQVPVLVAEADLPAGVRLGDLSIGVRQVESDNGLVTGEELGELEEWTLAHPLASGEPLLPSLLRAPEMAAAPNLFAVAVEESHAVLGRISAGDRVDVYVTWPGQSGERATTELFASDVYIVESRQQDGNLGSRSEIELLLAVDDDLAARLATAVRSGELDLVKRGP